MVSGTVTVMAIFAQSILDPTRAGDIGRVKELLQKQPSLVNAKNEREESPVLLAAYYGRADLLRVTL